MKIFSRSLFKYLYFSLADVVFMVVLVLNFTLDSDPAGNIRFSFAEIYLLFGTPLYLFLRGVFARLIFKKIWIPNLIFFASVWLASPIISWELEFSFIFTPAGILLAMIVSVVSLLGSSITNGILRINKQITPNNKRVTLDQADADNENVLTTVDADGT